MVFDNLSVSSNRTKVVSANLNPYAVLRVGRNAKVTFGVDRGIVRYKTNTLNDTDRTKFNVNVDSVADGHSEIKSSDFPIPKHLKLLTRFSDGFQTRHVTSIYMKINS